MTVYQGTSGYFTAGAAGAAATVGEINSWTITKSSDPIDVSVFADRWKRFVNGSVGWTASLSGFYYPGDPAQEDIEDSIDDGSAIEMYAHISSTIYYYGSGYATNVTVEQSHDGVASTSFDIQGTSELYRSATV